MATVSSLVGEKPVVIFSKSTCCLSHSVTSLIRSFGANLSAYDLDKIENGSQIESELLQMGIKPSVPAVFIGQQFRGGSKKIMSLHVRNELVPMLKEAGAIWM
jgi:glutaredoxin 3